MRAFLHKKMFRLQDRHYRTLTEILKGYEEGLFDIVISDGEYDVTVCGWLYIYRQDTFGDGIYTPREEVISVSVRLHGATFTDESGKSIEAAAETDLFSEYIR